MKMSTPRYSRRNFIHHSLRSMLATTVTGFASHKASAKEKKTLRFGITPVISYKQSQTKTLMAQYLQQKLGVPVQFFVRQKYSEIIQMLDAGQLDVAWICGYPYVNDLQNLSLIATPLFNGQPFYRSYLITRYEQSNYHSILDFKDKIFAFSDPDSFSGHIVPEYHLIKLHQNPKNFFQKTFYTYLHEQIVDAVIDGVADGGSIDGYVWETLKKQGDKNVSKTRIVWKSQLYAFPPIVSPKNYSYSQKQQLIQAFATAHLDRLGQSLLKILNLDGFKPPEPALYDKILHISQFIKQNS